MKKYILTFVFCGVGYLIAYQLVNFYCKKIQEKGETLQYKLMVREEHAHRKKMDHMIKNLLNELPEDERKQVEVTATIFLLLQNEK